VLQTHAANTINYITTKTQFFNVKKTLLVNYKFSPNFESEKNVKIS